MIFNKVKFSIRKSFFLRSFIKYFILLMIPLTLIVPYSCYNSYNQTKQSIEFNNWNMLHQIQVQMDSLLELSENANSYLSYNDTSELALLHAFQQKRLTLNVMKQLNNVTNYLQNMVVTNDYVNSAYVYYKNDNNRFITSQSGVSNISRYNDTAWLTKYADVTDNIWCEARSLKAYSFSEPQQVITIYQKIYTPLSTSRGDGVIAINFNSKSIKAYIDTLNLYQDQNIMFIGNDGSVLFQNASLNGRDIWHQIGCYVNSDKDYSTFTIDYENVHYVASLIKPSSKFGWYYLSLVPFTNLYDQLISLIKIIILLFTITVIISVVLSLISARKDYRQINSILKTFDNANRGLYKHQPKMKQGSDPYNYILHNIIELFIEKDYLKIQISEEKYRKRVMEMQALQQQINPHFLHNTINTIYWESVKLTNSPNSCTNIISDLSEIMEYALSNPREKVPISQEIDYLKNYINIQNVRYGNKITVVWDIDSNAMDFLVIKMILQPLVENSICHGLKEKDFNGIIKLRIRYRKTHVHFQIFDSGEGIPELRLKELKMQLQEDNEPEDHIGLFNTNLRLVLNYGNPYRIRVYSRFQAGTLISFSIPIDKSI